MDNRDLAGQKLLLAFKGKTITPEMIHALDQYRPAGITLFRSFNIDNPFQVKQLISALQEHAKEIGLPPLLIATDQEGGQLMAVGEGTTPLPGNLALGATGSVELTQQAGEVLGRELAAMGINMDYAPCCDVNINPRNPVIGTRSFGEDPQQVAELAAAVIKGIQSQGVAAVAKHFPGHGDTVADSHHGLPSLPHDLDRLRSVEFPPFQAAIQSDVKLVMSAHLSLPAIDGENAPPATLSSKILSGILREELGFQGVIVSDAMDMHAIQQGDRLGEECVRAASAGIDLLLITSDPVDHQRAYSGLLHAIQTNSQVHSRVTDSVKRILDLKKWLGHHASVPGMDMVGCASHLAIANEIAERSITLVRDEAHLLPLKLDPTQQISVIIPQPIDLTPADTSSYITPGLAKALRQFHKNVNEIVVPYAPDQKEIQETLQKVSNSDLVICGTLNAFACAEQAELVRRVLQSGIPTIVAAMRMPYDLTVFPDAPTYLCTYSIQEPSMRALARVLTGQIVPQGRLPVSIPGMYSPGHRFS